MKVAIIGGGPAGMMAGISASANGADVVLFEKNNKLGKKIYITGKGRCNVTNACDKREFLNNVATNSKFLFGAIGRLDSDALCNMLTDNGLALKVERGNRVFPQSDKASDVTATLEKMLRRNGVVVRLNSKVQYISKSEEGLIVSVNGEELFFDRVIVATGGVSYSPTGSDGDGYKFAQQLGHNIVEPRPALCELLLKENHNLEGLSLKNVEVSVLRDGKCVATQFGEMLFTSHGVSGPCVLTLSSLINKKSVKGAVLSIDLKPALTDEQLDQRLQRDFAKYINKDFRNCLFDLLPERLCNEVVLRSKINPFTKVNKITAEQRRQVGHCIKNLTFTINSLGDIERAIVTCGGVDVKQVNPSTMQSKVVKGLYFAGEALDVDAFTGGFNMQIAFCTGYTAGMDAAKEY